MAPKRPHDDDPARSAKKQRKGFSVGPANLPDGTYKRKVQKIKKDLIHKAKLKQSYAKLKARQEASSTAPPKSVYDRDHDTNSPSANDTNPTDPVPEPTLNPHPDRQKQLDAESSHPSHSSPPSHERRQKRPRPRADPFAKEAALAAQKKAQAAARQQARQDAERDRAAKLAERERERRIMAKARGGPNGQRKLGRESTVLLERARRLVGKT